MIFPSAEGPRFADVIYAVSRTRLYFNLSSNVRALALNSSISMGLRA